MHIRLRRVGFRSSIDVKNLQSAERRDYQLPWPASGRGQVTQVCHTEESFAVELLSGSHLRQLGNVMICWHCIISAIYVRNDTQKVMSESSDDVEFCLFTVALRRFLALEL